MNRLSRERGIPLILVLAGLVLTAIGALWKLGASPVPLALAALIADDFAGDGVDADRRVRNRGDDRSVLRRIALSDP